MTELSFNELPPDTPQYIAKRREGRETVLGLIYEAELKQTSLQKIVERLPLPLNGYADFLCGKLFELLETIDTSISDISKGWEIERMPSVDLSILRLAMCEVVANTNVPAGVIISEAVELAAKYSTDSSGPFINGVLAEACRRFRPDEPVGNSPE
ncbi:MAG: transcription antitermination factor NusB [Acidimicrobiales bacterium]|nr:transcription antitermination factor NusB [Acidimicrobiales bacterium]